MPFPFQLSQAPWSLLMAIASLGIVYFIFRRRADVLEGIGFTSREVALLCLGSIAGWAVNIPVAILGGTYLAVNVGGTIVPILLIGWWIRTRKLKVLPALVGTAVVAFVAWRIVEFVPEQGIVARYPTFFLPIVVALVVALVLSVRRPAASVPLAYASGTLGALIGADLMHVPDMRAYFASSVDAGANTVISIGGAGVLDMVFLAGTLAMALNLALVVSFSGRRPPQASKDEYPARPVHIEDPPRVHREFRELRDPDVVDRALHHLALSDLALREGDYAWSVRMSWQAVGALLEAPAVAAFLGNGVPPALRHDLEQLRREDALARAAPPRLRVAGEANVTAKTLVGALLPRAREARPPSAGTPEAA